MTAQRHWSHEIYQRAMSVAERVNSCLCIVIKEDVYIEQETLREYKLCKIMQQYKHST